MANSTFVFMCIIFACGFVSSSSSPSSSSSTMCARESDHFFNSALQSQCSLSFSQITPLQVDGDFLDSVMTSNQRNMYTSVLFHASWCPFSQKACSTFEVLSSMFPQIEHLTIEQSSVMPSIFSRYGIHSFPSIIMVDQTSTVRYHGKKDLPSLVKFYKETTGCEPVQNLVEEHHETNKKSVVKPWNGSLFVKEIITREPYLALSVLFISLRMFLLVFPKMMSFLKAFWASYVPQLNLDIFGETSHMLGRLFHTTDLKRVWRKLRLCKMRNFHRGAKNVSVWASSLASVSVAGEPSSSCSGR